MKWIPKIGESVKVRKDISGISLSKHNMDGWQGRVISVSELEFCKNCEEFDTCDHKLENSHLIEVELDSITLKKLKKQYIIESLESDIDFGKIDVDVNELVKAKERDTLDETRSAKLAITAKYGFVSELEKSPEPKSNEASYDLSKVFDHIVSSNVPYLLKSFSPETKKKLLKYLLKEKTEKKKKKKK